MTLAASAVPDVLAPGVRVVLRTIHLFPSASYVRIEEQARAVHDTRPL
jgi:hypothetical protein